MKTRIILFLSAAISFAVPLPLCGQVQGYNTVSRNNPDDCKYVVVYRSSGKVLGRFISRYEAERYVKERLETDASMKTANAKAEVEKQVAECFGLNSTKGINAGITSEHFKCTSNPYAIIEPRREGVVGLACDAAESSVDLLNKVGGAVSDGIGTALDFVSDGIGAVAEYFQPAEEYDSPSQADDWLPELLNESTVQAPINDNSNLIAAANSNSDPAVKPEVYVNVTHPSERKSTNPALAVKKQSETSEQTASSAKGIVKPGIQADALYSYNEKASVDEKANSINSFYLRASSQEERQKELGNAVASVKADADLILAKAIVAVDKENQPDYNDANSELLRFSGSKDNSGHFWNTIVKDDELREKVLDKLVEVCTNPQSKEVDTRMLRRVVDYVDGECKNAARDKSSSPVVMPHDEDKDWKAAQRVLSVLRKECDNGMCQ